MICSKIKVIKNKPTFNTLPVSTIDEATKTSNVRKHSLSPSDEFILLSLADICKWTFFFLNRVSSLEASLSLNWFNKDLNWGVNLCSHFQQHVLSEITPVQESRSMQAKSYVIQTEFTDLYFGSRYFTEEGALLWKFHENDSAPPKRWYRNCRLCKEIYATCGYFSKSEAIRLISDKNFYFGCCAALTASTWYHFHFAEEEKWRVILVASKQVYWQNMYRRHLKLSTRIFLPGSLSLCRLRTTRTHFALSLKISNL